MPGAYHRIPFRRTDDGEPVFIETTRPELIPACVALVAHPDDERYQPLFGTTVRTPLFGVEVEVKAHELADPEKGSGIAMICTFGDLTDVIWWRELQLADPLGRRQRRPPARRRARRGSTVDRRPATPTPSSPARPSSRPRRRIVELLARVGRPRRRAPRRSPTRSSSTRRATARSRSSPAASGTSATAAATPTCATPCCAAAKELHWHPPYMQVRYENWVDGLNGDWLISPPALLRRPVPGLVPRSTPTARSTTTSPIVPDRGPPARSTRRPTRPTGFDESPARPARRLRRRPRHHGHLGHLVAHPADRHRLGGGPRPLRPHLPDGPAARRPTRSSAPGCSRPSLRSHLEHDTLPWTERRHLGLGPRPRPQEDVEVEGQRRHAHRTYIEQFGADAVRYWAASGRPGTDTAFDEGQMKVGRRLAIKMLNASRFALGLGDGQPRTRPAPITEPLDRAMLAALADLVDEATNAFEGYDYARALERTEAFFWTLLRPVPRAGQGPGLRLAGRRGRGVGPGRAAARAVDAAAAVRPVPPVRHRGGLVVVAGGLGPPGDLARRRRAARAVAGDGDPLVVRRSAAEVLGEVRKAKTEAKRSLKTDVDRVVVTDTAARLAALGAAVARRPRRRHHRRGRPGRAGRRRRALGRRHPRRRPTPRPDPRTRPVLREVRVA